jgi:uncharacterized Zn-binding protein involved in type VI secretion
MQAAARLNDPIAHTSAMEGLVKGALAGALVGAGLVLGAALIVGTGGLTAPLVFGLMLTGVAMGAWIGEFVGSLSFFNKIKGKIASGSSNVFVNFKPLARAEADTGKCSEHGPAPPKIATGSGSVFINGYPAARVDDVLGCSGFIAEGSPDVFIGGEQVHCESVTIKPEVSGWVHGIVMVTGIAGALLLGGWAVAPGIVGGFAVGYVGGEAMGWAGRQAGDWLSENIGGKPSDWEKTGAFVGQALGGWLGAKGGPKAWKLAKRIEVKPNALGVNGGNIRIRRGNEPSGLENRGYRPKPGERSMTRAEWKESQRDQRLRRNVRLDKVRYSQGDVSPNASDGTPIKVMADNMKEHGWDTKKGVADMVEYPDGRIVTLDHRRLVAASQAGLEEVPARVHPAREPIDKKTAERFKLRTKFTDPETGRVYKRRAVPSNWGEAAKFRAANQRGMGFPDFPIEGSPKLPEIKGGKKADE